MATALTGEVSVLRISELANKLLVEADLSNYNMAIDNLSDPDSKQIPLDLLKTLFDSSIINNSLLWEIYFPNVNYAVEVLHKDAATLDSVDLGIKVNSIEYSIDDGATWLTPSFPITVAVNDTTKWRISAFNSAYVDGTIIINGTK